VDNPNSEEVIEMKCSVEGCPGEYEEKEIVHTVRYRGQVIVIDHVPAEVCSVCGDVLLKPEAVRRIETLLRTAPRPAGTVPLYEYA
jgi:YgiT-type zinc finger domain-containing protein